jgi:hypothetical protein
MLSIRFAMLSTLIFLSSSLCFGTENCLDSSVVGVPKLETAIGPGHPSTQNQLIFTFDASKETSAVGAFKGTVTFPNGMQYSVTGIIGDAGNPVSIEVGPPSISGNYVMTFQILTLTSGSINPSQGPYGTAENVTKSSQLLATFNVSNVGDQSSITFLNSP